MSRILACHLHDIIEIACLYGFEICLKQSNQERVQGRAMTTQVTSQDEESLVLLVNKQKVLVNLTDIVSMQAVTPNPHFELVDFRQQK